MSQKDEIKKNCDYFYYDFPGGWWYDQIEAMTFAIQVGVPTVNGYTGAFPVGYPTESFTSNEEPLKIFDWISKIDPQKRGCFVTGRSEIKSLSGEFDSIDFIGFTELETNGNDSWRWAVSPNPYLYILSNSDKKKVISFTLNTSQCNPVQEISILDGQGKSFIREWLEYATFVFLKYPDYEGYAYHPSYRWPYPAVHYDNLDKLNADVKKNPDGICYLGLLCYETVVLYGEINGEMNFEEVRFYWDETKEEGYFTRDNGQTAAFNMEGNIKSSTFGLLLGAQWKLGKRFWLDWQILGPHYGSSKGNIIGNSTISLSANEQTSLRNALLDINLPFSNEKVTVEANKATLSLDGPWAGLRTGLSLGFGF